MQAFCIIVSCLLWHVWYVITFLLFFFVVVVVVVVVTVKRLEPEARCYRMSKVNQ